MLLEKKKVYPPRRILPNEIRIEGKITDGIATGSSSGSDKETITNFNIKGNGNLFHVRMIANTEQVIEAGLKNNKNIFIVGELKEERGDVYIFATQYHMV